MEDGSDAIKPPGQDSISSLAECTRTISLKESISTSGSGVILHPRPEPWTSTGESFYFRFNGGQPRRILTNYYYLVWLYHK